MPRLWRGWTAIYSRPAALDLDRLLDLLYAFPVTTEYSNERQIRRARECRHLLCVIARIGDGDG